MHERFSSRKGLPRSSKKLEQGAVARPPTLKINDNREDQNFSCLQNEMIKNRQQTLSQVRTYFQQNNFSKNQTCTSNPEINDTYSREKINICSSVEDIIGDSVSKIVGGASFHLFENADSLPPYCAQSVVNKINVIPSNPSIQLSEHSQEETHKAAGGVMSCEHLKEGTTQYKPTEKGVSAGENIVREELSFEIHVFNEIILQIGERVSNQLFTPLSIGNKNNGLQTYIQLDSGATTNLMGVKMAEALKNQNLVNFTYPTFRAYLTDVQCKEICQPRLSF